MIFSVNSSGNVGESIKLSLTAMSVADSVGGKLTSVEAGADGIRVAMSLLDEERFLKAAHGVSPILVGSYGYTVTGLYKESGHGIAIIRKEDDA